VRIQFRTHDNAFIHVYYPGLIGFTDGVMGVIGGGRTTASLEMHPSRSPEKTRAGTAMRENATR
jgi:hypothetical protein